MSCGNNVQGLICLAILELVDLAVAHVVVSIGKSPHIGFGQVSPALVVVAGSVEVQGRSQAYFHVVARVDVQQFGVDIELHSGVVVVGLRGEARGSVVLFVILGRNLELILKENRIICGIRHF